MNTMPKLKINHKKLENNINIEDAYFQDCYQNTPKFFWNQPGEVKIAAIDLFLSSEFTSLEEFQSLSTYYQKILKNIKIDSNIPMIFIASAFNIDIKQKNSTWSNVPRGKIFIPKYLYMDKEGVKNLFTINEEINEPQIQSIDKSKPNQNLILENETSKQDFYSMIDKSKTLIKDTELEKIVISRKKTYQFKFNTQSQLDFIAQCENKFPKCATFLYDFKDGNIFFGVTPETLFKTKGNQFYSEAIAGTFDSKTEEASPKELKEHLFVVNDIKEKISNFSYNENTELKPATINLGKMTHLKTAIKCNLKEGTNPFDMIYNLHPTPAVAGYPKNIAIHNIGTLEKHDRGWYSGPIGWIDSNYNSNFKVAIRSGIAKKEKIHIYAGCGITKESDPESEYSESEMKFNSILSVLNHE